MKLGSNTYRQMQSFFLDKSNSSEKVTRYVTNSFPMGISEDGYVGDDKKYLGYLFIYLLLDLQNKLGIHSLHSITS